MNIIQVYKQYPTQEACLDHLTKVRWHDKPTCPYCKSERVTTVTKENRYHCNACNTSFSVTVQTVFHKTKIDLQRWFLAIAIVLNAKKGISARQLARDIEVNKNTAWFMLMRIRRSMREHKQLFEGIIEADETYIGGKSRNKHKDKRSIGTQGRSAKDKTPVFGILSRDGMVRAKKVKNVSAPSLQLIIKENVKQGSYIMTDEWRGYNGLDKKNYFHTRVNHGANQYVIGDAHTNSIESFWALLKRGIMGQYHHVTERYLNEYVNEFCFRHNNRDNNDVFQLVLARSVR